MSEEEKLNEANLFLESKLNEASENTHFPINLRCYRVEPISNENLPFDDNHLEKVIMHKFKNKEIIFERSDPGLRIIGNLIRWNR